MIFISAKLLHFSNLHVSSLFRSVFFLLCFFSLSGLASADTSKQANTGLHLSQDSVKEGGVMKYNIYVQDIEPNSPASKTDIRKGDKVININGINASQGRKDMERVNQLMQGNVNSSISIEVERYDGQKKTQRMTYVLERAIPVNPKKARVFGIGVTLAIDTILIKGVSDYAPKIQIVYPGSPAEKAGIQSGDYIVAVDDHHIDGGKTDVISQLVDVLLIDEPKEAQLLCMREKEGAYIPYTVNVTRVDISGYLKMPVQSLMPAPKMPIPESDDHLPLLENDRDGDGIYNADDACPDTPGVESLNPFENGCPAK
ncbi:hypothetical protein EMGBS15_06560 [Filimonas sp.]|nr:hypothetical protein EMGBS15_06560 [Filimonas sp.]